MKNVKDGTEPTTRKEASDLIAMVMRRTGWSRERVIAEGMFSVMMRLGDTKKRFVALTCEG